MSQLQKKPSALKRGHPTLENMNFYKFFSTFLGHFCPPGSGSTDPIESGSNPDPQPWFFPLLFWCCCWIQDPRWIKIRIREKHPGSTTLPPPLKKVKKQIPYPGFSSLLGQNLSLLCPRLGPTDDNGLRRLGMAGSTHGSTFLRGLAPQLLSLLYGLLYRQCGRRGDGQFAGLYRCLAQVSAHNIGPERPRRLAAAARPAHRLLAGGQLGGLPDGGGGCPKGKQLDR